MTSCKRFALVVLAVVSASGALAQEAGPPPVETSHITGNLYQLRCIGNANVIASVGDDGILLVDTGYGQTAEALKEAVADFGKGPARIIVNTHGDGDHVGGNALLGEAAVIIARPEVRRQMGSYFALPATDTAGLPSVTFDGETTVFFNGEEIRIFSAAGAHTAGDSVVYFTNSGIAHIGDLVLLGTLPNASPGRGGNARRLLEVLEDLHASLPANTTLFASHGGAFSMDELEEYIKMVKGTVAIVESEIAAGRSLANIIESEPLVAWQAWEDPANGLSSANWTTEIYGGLTGESIESICRPVTEALVEEGAEAAVARYRELRKSEPAGWDFAEAQLNMLGYQLLARNLVDDAIVILELNVETYPDAFNTHDSLGEAYLAAGRTEEAVASYETSLELNPENSNAAAVLARLGR